MEISNSEYMKLGINIDKLQKVDTIDELVETMPGMVTAKILANCSVSIDGYVMKIIKNSVLVMSYNTYVMMKKEDKHKLILPYTRKFSDFFNRYRGQDLHNKTLLIWRTGGLGDICFTQPLIKYLKRKYPTCKIIFGTSPHNVFIFKCWPEGLVDEAIVFPFDLNKLSNADYHLTFEGSIERCREAEKINCYDIFRKVAGLEFNVEDYPLELKAMEEDVNQLNGVIPENTILLHMRASSPIRILGSYRWVEIIKELTEKYGFNVGMIDSYNNASVYDKLIKTNNLDKKKVFNLCKLSRSINKGIAILHHCKALIGIDSSFTHIAAGLGKPVLGIYGPFLGLLRMKYYKTGDWVDSAHYSECKKWPCFYHQTEIENCPFVKAKKPVGCLLSISKDEIVDSFINLLNKLEYKDNPNDKE